MGIARLITGVWGFRAFILTSIVSEIKGRFARSRLGALWLILGPLAQAAMLATVLSQVLSAKLPGIENRYAYAVYLLAGTTCWTLFSEIVTRDLGIFRDHGNLIKKLHFPRLCLPVIVLGSALLNQLFLILSVLAIYLLIGHPLDLQLLWLPLLVLLTVLLAQGIGLVLGIFNVFLSDVGQAFGVILQLWFWATPIVYPLEIVPAAIRPFFALNPMFPLVRGYQNVMAFQQSPALPDLALVGAGVLALNGLALVLYRRASQDIVDAV